MYKGKNLIELKGATPNLYSLQVLYRVLGGEEKLSTYVCTEDGEPSKSSVKPPIPAETIALLKSKFFNSEFFDTNY
jgi:hypothetical protein